MKYYLTLAVTLLVVLTGITYLAPKNVTQDSLGGIARSVTNASTSITSSAGVQVLAPSRANYRRPQQDTAAILYCTEGVSSTAKVALGIRLTQGEEYVWSSKEGNLYSGAISCIANSTTSVVMSKEAFE